MKIIKSIEDLGALTDKVTETVKHAIKQISWSFVSNFSYFISVNNNFFCNKRYKWKKT